MAIPGLDVAPTGHSGLLAWVRECAELTEPDRVVWVDGSAAEWRRITDQLVDAGTFVRLNPDRKPDSFWPGRIRPTSRGSRTVPSSVAAIRAMPA